MGISDRLAGGLEGRAEEDYTVLMPDFFLDMIFFFILRPISYVSGD